LIEKGVDLLRNESRKKDEQQNARLARSYPVTLFLLVMAPRRAHRVSIDRAAKAEAEALSFDSRFIRLYDAIRCDVLTDAALRKERRV